VADVTGALVRVRAMAVALGGYVGGSQAGTKDQAATLTLRIPADRFEEALSRLHKLNGDVIVEATNEQDVTSAVVDLEARITNLQATEVQYRTLLAKAVKIEDILAVQTRLDDVRGQIEQLQAQHKELAGLADLSTLTVTLVSERAPAAGRQLGPRQDRGGCVRGSRRRGSVGRQRRDLVRDRLGAGPHRARDRAPDRVAPDAGAAEPHPAPAEGGMKHRGER